MGISPELCCQNSETDTESRTPAFQRFSCGVGHVMNDINRQLLSSFRLIIFMQVFGLSAANAGWLMLYGLFVVAVSSPISAFLVDRIKIPFLSRKIGRRKSWHLIGTVIGAIIVPFYFSSCFPCQSDRGQWQMMIYIAILNTILSFSFSLMEISHMSIIPVIAKDQSEAVELNAWRTAFSFLSGTVTFLVAWAILGQDASDHLSAESSMDFTVVTLILEGIGLVFAVIFHAGTKEPSERLSTTDADFLRKSSCTPSLSRPQSETFMETDNATGEHVPKVSEETKAHNGMNSFHETIGVELPSDPNATNDTKEENGIGTRALASNETHGVDCSENELGPCYPDHITDAKVLVSEVFSNNVKSDSLDVNCGSSPETIMSSKPSTVLDDPQSTLPAAPARKTVRDWLKDPHLYKVAIIFTCTMSVIMISYGYLPLFLIYRVEFGKEAIAYLPLIMLTSASVSSGISKKVVAMIGTKWCFIMAALLVIGAGLWFYFITQANRMMTYPATVLLGLGFSAMLVNALSFAAELIGDNKNTSGFVFAVMNLMSYITSGALFTTIQNLFPIGSNSEDCQECGHYVRDVFSFVPGSLAAISLLMVLLFQASKTACGRNVPKTDASMKSEGAIVTRL